MRFLDKFLNKKKMPASIAKERLQIILTHQKSSFDVNVKPEWITLLQEELITVIAKYTKVNKEDLKINLEKRDNIDLLEINITLPDHHNKE